MRGLIYELEKEKQKIAQIISMVENRRSNNEKENFKVSAMIKRNTVQFYRIDENSRYRYLSSSENERAQEIIKNEYYEKLYQLAKTELNAISRLEGILKKKSIDSAYEKIGKAKQKVVEPIISPKKIFIEDWLSEEYTGKSFHENSPEFYTDRGERVRSKSEKIIADKLYREGIQYRYEYPLELPGWGIVYPDFTILDVENRRNIIYEHFGMMDDENYASNAIAKVQRYASAGYHIGDNFFITMESSRNPLDSRTLDGIMKQLKS